MDTDNMEMLRILKPCIVYSDHTLDIAGEHVHVFEIYSIHKKDSIVIYSYGDEDDTLTTLVENK